MNIGETVIEVFKSNYNNVIDDKYLNMYWQCI